MNENEFAKRKLAAAQELKQMGAVSSHNTPKKTQTATKNESVNLPGEINIPFLDLFKTDSDITLILGILLLILGEKADKRLLFALIYILL